MSILLIVVPVLLLFYFVNDKREKKGLSTLRKGYIMPVAVFIIMLIVLYEMQVDPLEALIVFGFGSIIGSLIERV